MSFAGPPQPMGQSLVEAIDPTMAARAKAHGLEGRVPDTPTVTIPDTLQDALRLANKHLVLISNGDEQMDDISVGPQLEAMTAMLETIQRTEDQANAGG